MQKRRRWVHRVAESPFSQFVALSETSEVQSLQPSEPLAVDASACAQELLPGFVHFRNVLPPATQQALALIACRVAGASRQSGASGGWYRCEHGRWSLNDGSKARFWDHIACFPEEFRTLGEELVRLAGERFGAHLAVPAAQFQAQVGALNFYKPQGRMGWHVDDTNFAKPDRPIVMANLGDSADFGYKLRRTDPDSSVRLDSGDVIVFGGPARDLVHALIRVHRHTSPPALGFPAPPGAGRISVTWRDAGPEDGLNFNSNERLGLVVTENTLPRYLPRGSQTPAS